MAHDWETASMCVLVWLDTLIALTVALAALASNCFSGFNCQLPEVSMTVYSKHGQTIGITRKGSWTSHQAEIPVFVFAGQGATNVGIPRSNGGPNPFNGSVMAGVSAFESKGTEWTWIPSAAT